MQKCIIISQVFFKSILFSTEVTLFLFENTILYDTILNNNMINSI